MNYSRDKWRRWDKFIKCCGDMPVVVIGIMYDSYAHGWNSTIITIVDRTAGIMENR